MIIVDTNVLIDVERGKQSLKALMEQYTEENFCISAISILELYVGLGYTKAKKGEDFFQKQKDNIDLILTDFEILPISQQILRDSGLKHGELLAQGTTIDFEDIIIGISGELSQVNFLLTRNTSHFSSFSLTILSY